MFDKLDYQKVRNDLIDASFRFKKIPHQERDLKTGEFPTPTIDHHYLTRLLVLSGRLNFTDLEGFGLYLEGRLFPETGKRSAMMTDYDIDVLLDDVNRSNLDPNYR